MLIHPRRACAARVIVVGFVCVCVSVKSHLTSRMSNRAINEHVYSVACERQKICGDFPEKTAFKSYAAKHEFTGLPAVSFFRTAHSEAPASINDIQPKTMPTDSACPCWSEN